MLDPDPLEINADPKPRVLEQHSTIRKVSLDGREKNFKEEKKQLKFIYLEKSGSGPA
jgi:hypothetical protein